MKTVCCAREFVVTVTSQALTNQSAGKVPGCAQADDGILGTLSLDTEEETRSRCFP